jgi:hypothetical protein
MSGAFGSTHQPLWSDQTLIENHRSIRSGGINGCSEITIGQQTIKIETKPLAEARRAVETTSRSASRRRRQAVARHRRRRSTPTHPHPTPGTASFNPFVS